MGNFFGDPFLINLKSKFWHCVAYNMIQDVFNPLLPEFIFRRFSGHIVYDRLFLSTDSWEIPFLN